MDWRLDDSRESPLTSFGVTMALRLYRRMSIPTRCALKYLGIFTMAAADFQIVPKNNLSQIQQNTSTLEGKNDTTFTSVESRWKVDCCLIAFFQPSGMFESFHKKIIG